MRPRSKKVLSSAILLIGILALLLGLSCEDGLSPEAKSYLSFLFKSGCAQIELEVFIDDNFKDTVYPTGKHKYRVSPGTHTWLIQRASDDQPLWSGECKIDKNTEFIQPLGCVGSQAQ
jgi:hypothetical protein